MITNFENITFELNEIERDLVPIFVRALERKIGKENAITNSEIIKGIQKAYSIKLTGARVRKIIQYIRITGKVERLIASSKGYYVSNDKQELNDYIESLMQRAEQIEMLAKQIEFQKQKLIKN